MKKIFTIFLGFLLCFAFYACNFEDDLLEENSNSGKETETSEIGVNWPSYWDGPSEPSK